MADAALILDPQDQVLECNAAAEARYSKPRAQLLGLSYSQLTDTPGSAAVPSQAVAALARDGHWSGLLEAPEQEGGILVHVSLVRLVDGRGRALGVLRSECTRRSQPPGAGHPNERLLPAARSRPLAGIDAERMAAIIAAQMMMACLELDPVTVLTAICEQAQKLTAADGACIALRPDIDEVFRPAPGPPLKRHAPPANSLRAAVISGGQRLVCQDSVSRSCPAAEPCHPASSQSLVVAPLERGGDALGVLTVYRGAANAFSEADRDALHMLSGSFGAALSHACQLALVSRQALTDSLTGLANRAGALRHLQQALARQAHQGGQVGVIFLDLDHFKNVNDVFGHAAGDQVLVAVAQKLRTAIRRSDLAARYGGDEFLIICEQLPPHDEIAVLADRLLTIVPGSYATQPATSPGRPSGPISPARQVVRIGASIGVAVAVAPIPAQALLRAADEAMYDAKENGGNCHVHRYLRAAPAHRPTPAAMGDSDRDGQC
jgi:diguanylate cyclase (GGDEF)-like protein